MNDNELIKKEFFYDSEIRENKEKLADHESGHALLSDSELAIAELAIENATDNLRKVQRERYGWREVARLYENKNPGKIDFLRSKIIELKGQIADFEKTLSDYDKNVRDQEQIIGQLQARRSGNIGSVPSLDEIQEAQEKLLEIHRRFGIAEAGLPELQSDLEKAKAELEALQKKNQSHSGSTGDRVYSSPSAEVDGRAKQYQKDHDVEYTTAVEHVLNQDSGLAESYYKREVD